MLTGVASGMLSRSESKSGMFRLLNTVGTSAISELSNVECVDRSLVVDSGEHRADSYLWDKADWSGDAESDLSNLSCIRGRLCNWAWRSV